MTKPLGQARKRAMSYSVFVRHYEPIDPPNGGLWEHSEIPRSVTDDCVWTVVDGDNGESYVIPGWHWVNRLGYIITKKPCDDSYLEVKW